MFFVEGFFELFEMLLSYFSNTLSFVRIGAFAVSHAAMMEVVLMLAGVESGNTNWVVVVLGNLFVCLMEGLVVGIQVLRLEYYEMFSRFYKGSGRKFEPYNKKQENGKIKEEQIMTLTVRLILIVALVFSIIIPFGYYLIGEKNRGRYKCALAANVFSFWGLPCGVNYDVRRTECAGSGCGGIRFNSNRTWLYRGRSGYPVYPVSAVVLPWQVRRARRLEPSVRIPASLVSRLFL